MTLVNIGHQLKEAESDRQTDAAIESSEEFIHHIVTESGTEKTGSLLLHNFQLLT